MVGKRLWLLAAALAAATVYLTMSIVHDTSRRREAVRTVAQSLADQVAEGLSVRAAAVILDRRDNTAEALVLRDSVFPQYVHRAVRANARLVEIDTASIQLVSPDSSIRIGQLSALHTYRAAARASGPLEGWTVLVALHPAQLPDAFVAPLPHERLWLLAIFGLLTAGVILAAIGASQRELVMARTRSEFVAGVSHELRMPLAQILLAGETLAMGRERDDNERERLSRSIVREARRLVGLVENVLFFSRSDPVASAARLETIDAGTLFANVMESVDLAASDARQTIVSEPGINIRLFGNPDMLRHALVNLVDNSMKYGKPGQRIRLIAERTGEGRVQLHVDDEGAGVPPGERARVFGAYERLARDRESERTGTGLGLAIVQRIAEACGGTASLGASPDGGARATIELGAPA